MEYSSTRLAAVPYGANTFAVIGGYKFEDGGHKAHDSAYMFDPDENAWRWLKGVKLDTGRGASAAILVDQQWFPACDDPIF